MTTPTPDGYRPGSPLEFRAFAGVRNDTDAQRFTVADLVTAENIDLDNEGQAHRRRGRRLLSAGNAHSVWADGDDCLLVQGNALKRLRTDWSLVTLATGLTANLPLAYLALDGRIYWSNGIESGIVEGNTSRSWGFAAPAPPEVAATTAGGLLAGRYQVALTAIAADGRASGARLSSILTLAATGGFTVTLPAPAAGVSAYGIYCSAQNGDALYCVAEVDAAAGSYAFAGSEQDFLGQLDSRFLEPCPGGHALALHAGRIFVASDTELVPSLPHDFERFDPFDALRPDGTRVQVIAGVDGGLYVGTERAVYFYTGNDLAKSEVREIVQYGAVPGSLAWARGDELLDGITLSGPTPVFATTAGLYAGSPGGQLFPLTAPRYQPAEAGQGAAVMRRDRGYPQYLGIFRP